MPVEREVATEICSISPLAEYYRGERVSRCLSVSKKNII